MTSEATFPLEPHQQALIEAAFGHGYFCWAGMRLVALETGRAIVEFTPRSEMLTPWKTLNGAVVNGLAELPSTLALLSGLAAGELPVTNDIFVQHLRPLPGDAAYTLTARLLNRSRSMAWTEVDVAAAGKTISLARITKTILFRPD